MDLTKIHETWQRKWAEAGLGDARIDKSRKKFFMIFAYPGISGFLHVGHMRGYSYTDVLCRFKRLQGYNVLFPVGTHASGNLPYAFVKKLENKNADWIDYLKRNGATDAQIKGMGTAEGVVDFFNKNYVEDSWKKFGFLCDWSRFTSTINSDYQRFIQWQFVQLRNKNLLVQKPYYATFCPEDGPVAVDPSETDISKGGKAEKQEYTLLKFAYGDMFLVAATLRPETVFGQTNLWINPDGKYVKVDVNGETWVMSAEAAEKLGYQKDNVLVVGEIDPKTLLGKMCKAPMIGKEIPILPASFCDPKVGTGVVTCVPSDAPYDYIALRDVQNNKELLKKYKIKEDVVKNITLIPIIKSKGYGDSPAKEIVEKLKITSQADTEKLNEATAEIYKVGFHSGVMRENAGEYAGKSVPEAKELIKATMLESKEADLFHDLSEEVICRCGLQVVIKRIDDQWFIKYSDPEVTARSKEHAKKMWVYPQDFAQNLPNILDWFSDRACTRLGRWVGTKLPFDSKWIIEPIADSTLYPMYYLIAPYVNSGELSTADLTDAFFDYVFLGKGKPANDLWKTVREDVLYWYPLDVNLGGVDHRTVHFPVFIMNHVGVLPASMWPKGIVVNAWITGKGGKISKSKGGAQPIPGAIDKYGVDTMRLYYAHIGSPDSAVVWDEDVLINYKHTLERIAAQIEEIASSKGKEQRPIDHWLKSELHSILTKVTESFERFDLREAATHIYFTLPELLKWYSRRGGNNKDVLHHFVSVLTRMMVPITPHLAEEFWDLIRGQGFASSAHWPNVEKDAIHPSYAAGESLVQNVIGDIRQVLKLAKVEKPQEIVLFVTPSWKSSLIEDLKKELGITRNMGEILKKLLTEERKTNAKEVSKIVQSALKDPTRVPHFVLPHHEEYKILNDARSLLEQEFGGAVKLVKSEDSKEAKATAAMPGKPAILVR